MEAHAAQMTKFSEAVKPLYASLDDSQKHRLVVMLHVLGWHHGHHFGGGEGHGWGGPEHKG